MYYLIHIKNTGADPEILKRGGTLCRPPWLADEDILGFWWSEKAKIKLETISFWQNISISILKFCPFLYTMKACQWNLINFSKLANALIRKEKIEKSWTLFYNRLFCKVLWYDNESFFLFHQLIHSPIVAFGYQHDARNLKSGSMERQIARQTANYNICFKIISIV